jgi:hypothetical protein
VAVADDPPDVAGTVPLQDVLVLDTPLEALTVRFVGTESVKVDRSEEVSEL